MRILAVFLNGDIFHPKAGNEIRVHNLIKQLVKEDEIITLESDEYEKTNAPLPVKRCFVNPLVVGNTRFGTFFADLNPSYILSLCKILKSEKPELIHISYPRGIAAARILKKLMGKDFIIVYEAQDVEAKRTYEITLRARMESILKRWVAFIYSLAIEKISCKLADHVIAVSREEANEFIRRYSIKKEKISVVPTGTLISNLESYDRLRCRRKLGLDGDNIVIMFHGTYSYYPNREAIKLIKDYIAPRICEKYKNVLFVIAGKGAPKYEEGKVKFLGFVDDLNELLVASDIAIVPILRGTGTKVKIMDYMGAGLPIVTTKKGIEGIECENGKHAIVVDDVNAEFIKAIESLIENRSKREELGRNARKLAEEKYDWNKIGEKLDMLYRTLVDKLQNSKLMAHLE
ncbi:MAG: glycosyltransferase family 4 protein [Candidatus Baldrarchaeia archaeon]